MICQMMSNEHLFDMAVFGISACLFWLFLGMGGARCGAKSGHFGEELPEPLFRGCDHFLDATLSIVSAPLAMD